MKLKKFISIVFICILAVSVVGCTSENKDIVDNEDKPVVEDNPNQEKELTGELLGEKEVSIGQVYFQDDWVIGVMIIKDEVLEEDAKELAQQYAEKLKAKYKDKKVNVQAVLKDNNIANIVLE